jgi:threonine synthase
MMRKRLSARTATSAITPQDNHKFLPTDPELFMLSILPSLLKNLDDFGSCAILKNMHYPESALTHLECPECGKLFEADTLQKFCADCKSPLLARYDLGRAKDQTTRSVIASRPRGLWRWAEFLPVRAMSHRLTLGEGDTPLLKSNGVGKKYGFNQLYIKDESTNPTGSFKARGLVMAVSRALELGAREIVVFMESNAGSALAAYAARGRMRAHVYMPKEAPLANRIEVQKFGADLRLVDGLILDEANLANSDAAKINWLDVSTFKEPYRCEGKKTMGFEIAESFDWELPDVIIYPTGGGTGLVGMWKAFEELEALGWIGAKRPRMVSVQAAGCAPIVRAVRENKTRAEFWEGAQTIAAGLRVPGAFADRLILRAISESHGTAIAVTDEEIMTCQQEIAGLEGIFAAPEGAATLSALIHLREDGWLAHGERIVLFNTGTGLKYL